MTRDGLVMLGVAFLAGVAVGVEYMNAAGSVRPTGAWCKGCTPATALEGSFDSTGPDERGVEPTPTLIPAAPMPAEAVTVARRFRPMLIPVECVRLDGVEGMGQQWLRSWGDGDLPPALPTCVNANGRAM